MFSVMLGLMSMAQRLGRDGERNFSLLQQQLGLWVGPGHAGHSAQGLHPAPRQGG